MGLLWLPEELETVVFAYVLEAGFYQFTYFFLCLGHFADVRVHVFEAHELSVLERVLDSSVAQYLHDVQDVFGQEVFHRAFPVSQCVEMYLHEAWVSHFRGDFIESWSAGFHGRSGLACVFAANMVDPL